MVNKHILSYAQCLFTLYLYRINLNRDKIGKQQRSIIYSNMT